MPKKRNLTDEEKALWSITTRDVRPFALLNVTEVEDEPAQPIKKIKVKRAFSHPIFATSLPKTISKTQKETLPGLDHHSQKKLKTGDYPIDATLDLHGLTREQAFSRWQQFFSREVEHSSRCLLVITGKGSKAKLNDSERGILRELFPKWLALDEVKPWVLRVVPAAPKHGGSGAFYVLLKRRRT